MGLLVLADSVHQLRLGSIVLAHLSGVVDSVRHQDRVAEHQPAQGAGGALEENSHVQGSRRSCARHQVDEEQWHRRAMRDDLVRSFIVKLLDLLALVNFSGSLGSMQVLVRIELRSCVVVLEDAVDIILKTLDDFLGSFH